MASFSSLCFSVRIFRLSTGSIVSFIGLSKHFIECISRAACVTPCALPNFYSAVGEIFDNKLQLCLYLYLSPFQVCVAYQNFIVVFCSLSYTPVQITWKQYMPVIIEKFTFDNTCSKTLLYLSCLKRALKDLLSIHCRR